MQVPAEHSWLFWDVALDQLDLQRDSTYVLSRVLERGRMLDVRWVVRHYGLDAIRGFFESDYHSEISERTLSLWRAFFGVARGEWPTQPGFRRTNAALWFG